MEGKLKPPRFKFGDFFTAIFTRPKIFSARETISSEKSSEKILAFIRKNSTASAKEIAVTMGVSARAIEKQIAALKKKKLLKRIGPDKGGYWEVVNIKPPR